MYDAAIEAGSGVAELGGQVLDYGIERLISFVEGRFPTFIAFLRSDPMEFLKERFTAALDFFLGGLVTRIRREGLLETLQSVFGGAIDSVQTMLRDLARGDCTSLFGAIKGLIDFADALFGDELRSIRDFASDVGGVLGDLWAQLGVPVVDSITEVAGDFWKSLTETASAFWAATSDVRRWFSEVWQSFLDAFGVVWDSGDGLLDWLLQRATEAWNAIKEALGPALVPLGVLAAILLQFTPFSPILNAYLIYEVTTTSISWIYDHWEDIESAFIDAREYLHGTVLPQIMEGVQMLSQALGTAAAWMSDILGNIASTGPRVARA